MGREGSDLVVVVVLSPEESEITAYGALPEPSYRPFPGSARDRERGEPEAQEMARWDAPWGVEDSGPTPDDEDDDAPASEADLTLPRIGAAERWKQSSRVFALLVARRGNEHQIVAIGVVYGRSRAPIRGARNVDIHVRYVLRQAIALDEVRAGLDARQRALFDARIAGELWPLPPRLSSRVMHLVTEIAPFLQPAFVEMGRQVRAELAERLRSRRVRPTVLRDEAASSALHFFAPAWHLLEPEPDPDPSGFAQEIEQLSGVIENDFISDDAAVFPGWDRSAYSRGGWWEFRNGGRRLLVKNINVSPQENRTGADLVYVRRVPDAFVLVQYKLLEKLSDGRLVFRPDGRLDGQIARMLALENVPEGGTTASDATDSYRIGQGFSFVKFVFPDAARPERPGELVPGFYLPGEYARRILSAPGAGPRGGIVYYIDGYRHLNPDTFARLVRDSWVGSAGDATAQLRQAFNLRDSNADLVLAVDEPV